MSETGRSLTLPERRYSLDTLDSPRKQADGRDRGTGKIMRSRNADARMHAQHNKAPPANTSTHRNSRARPHPEEESNCQSQINRKAKKSARVRTKAQRQGKTRRRGGQNKTKTETADPSGHPRAPNPTLMPCKARDPVLHTKRHNELFPRANRNNKRGGGGKRGRESTSRHCG
jgi:hypothetical protein